MAETFPDPDIKNIGTQGGIDNIGKRIQNGTFQWGDVSDKPAVAIKQYQAVYGRTPTPLELTNALSLSGGDINAYIAGQKYQEDNSPANVYAKQQAKWQAAAPEHYDSVNQITKSLLGRQATQDELSHYATLIASGQADPYQIQQFIQSTPEYQNTQDTNFRNGVDAQLQKSDSDFFNTQKGNISQQYALMGRATSPALDVALTQLASQLNANRSNYLTQLSASQYGGNKSAALNNYQNTQNQVQGQINQNTQGIYNNDQNVINRQNNYSDYLTNKSAFDAYARNQGGSSGLAYLNGAASGATAGSAFGPYGAAIGAGVGLAGTYASSQH